MKDIASEAKKIMAGVDIGSEYRIGRSFINLERFESIASHDLDYVEKERDDMGIDEIGWMELFLKDFEKKVKRLLTGRKPLRAVVQRNGVEKYKEKNILYTVEVINRNQMSRLIFSKMMNLFRIL